MKRFISAALIFLLILLTSTLFASGKNQISSHRIDNAESNLLVGLNSDNFGLKTSSAYYLGEIKSSKAVIPLMKLVSDDDEDIRVRIMAALSLYKIGDARGIFRLQRMSQFCEDCRLKDLSGKFYISYLQNEAGYRNVIDEESIIRDDFAFLKIKK